MKNKNILEDNDTYMCDVTCQHNSVSKNGTGIDKNCVGALKSLYKNVHYIYSIE